MLGAGGAGGAGGCWGVVCWGSLVCGEVGLGTEPEQRGIYSSVPRGPCAGALGVLVIWTL